MNIIYAELFKLLEDIKRTHSHRRKIELLQKFPHQKELKQLLYLAYDPQVVFGITSKAFATRTGGMLSEVDPNILEQISSIKGRNEKIRAITTATAWLTPKARQYILSALDKDLNIGIGIKTINKALPNTIREFNLQLAYKQTEKRYNLAFSDTDWLYYNLKIDGVRCKVEVHDKDDIRFFSRYGREMEDFLVDNIKYEIQTHYDVLAGRHLDCEIYSDHFQKFMRLYRRKNIDLNSIYIRNSTRLAIFDLIDMADKPLTARVKEMENLQETLQESLEKARFITFLKYHKIPNDYSKIAEIASEYIKGGDEGIIIKHPHKPYEFKRSNYWLKFKNKETIDLKVIGYYSGEKNTMFENMLGGLILDYNGEELRCGSGFSEDERKELWANITDIIGMYVEVSYMEATETGSLRHPVFERFRFDLER